MTHCNKKEDLVVELFNRNDSLLKDQEKYFVEKIIALCSKSISLNIIHIFVLLLDIFRITFYVATGERVWRCVGNQFNEIL